MRTIPILVILTGGLVVTACVRAVPEDDQGKRQLIFASESASQRQQSEPVVFAKPKKETAAKMKHVEAGVYLATDHLQAGQRQRFAVVIDIEQGWHINTNPARPSYVIPTSVKIAGKKEAQGKTVAIAEINYPEGRKLAIPGMKVPLTVYDGRVIFFGDLKVPEEFAGQRHNISFALRYQICNDRRCLAPKTVALEGKGPISKEGESVQRVNAEIFKKDPRRDASRK